MEQMIPVFFCKSPDKTREFYEALGFTVTHWQREPYFYGAVNLNQMHVHFTKGSSSALCLVQVPEVGEYHRAFADGLRAKYGRVPIANSPRITRLRPGQTRFQLFDVDGNELLFINKDEPDIDYESYDMSGLSPLMQALENVAFLRDTYADDKAAAKFLDKKLRQHPSAEPLDRALALAARAELAVAMGETERLQAVRDELKQIPLSDQARDHHRDALHAADNLECWLTQ